MIEQSSPIVKVQTMPFVAGFNWSVGKLMEKFIRKLADKKLLASKCPSCGYVYTPPRNRCGKCSTEISEKDLIELSGKGILTGYTVAQVDLDDAGNFKDLDKPRLIGAVKLEGADSTVFLPLEGVTKKDVAIGMKVQVVWNSETKGAISDLKGAKPVKAKTK